MRMSVECVRELWIHILNLQSEGETARDRFRWTHWWKRVGKGEDAGERHKAAYGQTPRPKHIVEAKRKGHAARTKRAPPPGAFGLNQRDADATDPEPASSSENDGPAKAKGGKKKKGRSKKTHMAPPPVKNGTKTAKGKGKAKAGDDSDSAKSSGVGTDPDEVEPSLRSEGSPDSLDQETFDLNVSTAGIDDGLDSDGNPTAGPSKPKTKTKPKPRPVKKAAPLEASPEKSRERTPERSPDDTPGPEDLPHIPGPWDDAPVGPHGLAKCRIPPRGVLVEAADGHPPSWVESDPERVLPFLWSLSGESDYRGFLKSWRHMVRSFSLYTLYSAYLTVQYRRRSHLREPRVSQWANWDSDCWGIPSHYHAKRESWATVMEWISDHAPTPTSSCSDVQQWSLIVGLALRDIYTGNEVDPDPEEPVPRGGPEYLRNTESLLRDAVDLILPLCVTSQHPGPPAGSAGQTFGAGAPDPKHSASTVPMSRKDTRIFGKRGAPPGMRPAALIAKNRAKGKEPMGLGTTSAEEVEMAVTGKVGSSSLSSTARHSRLPPKCYVELPAPSSRRATATRSHQGPPPRLPPRLVKHVTEAEDVVMQEADEEEQEEEERDSVPAPPVRLRRSSRKTKAQGK